MELPNRTQHIHIIGQTGTGKSTFQKQLIYTDISRGDGVFFIDPHGFDTDHLLGCLPSHRRKDIIIFDPADQDFPVAWNPIENIPDADIPLVASTYVDTMKDAWGFATTSTANMDMYLYNITVSLIEAKETLLGMPLMLTSPEYRTKVVSKTRDPMVRHFWTEFYEPMSKTDKGRQIQSTLNKSFVLFSDPRIRNMLGQRRSAFQLSDIIRDQRIFFARLSQGKLGVGKTKLIGSLLLSQLHLAALSREPGPTFHVHLDELHTFAGHTLELMLSGVRKFDVSMTLVHQHLAQLSPELKSAVLGNAGTKVVFRVSMDDSAEFMRLMAPNNTRSQPFELRDGVALIMTGADAEILVVDDELPEIVPGQLERSLAHTRRHYGSNRLKIEKQIRRFIEKA